VADVEVIIDAIGAQGDGIAETPEGRLFVPFTVPGDRVRVRLGERRREGTSAEVLELRAAGAHRVGPACAHFGDCGGCDLQHWQVAETLAWKRRQVEVTLAHRGLTASVAPVVATPPRERRRARLAVSRDGDSVTIGFRARASHRVVDVQDCPVLNERLAAALPALRQLGALVLKRNGEAVFEITDTEGGVDVLVERPKGGHGEPNADLRTELARFAAAHKLARMSWRSPSDAELIAQLAAPTLRFGSVPVELPAGAFVQASPTAEAALLAEVLAAAYGAKRAADLYAGCGAFALPLAAHAAVLAVEGDAESARALDKAARQAMARVAVEHRDLDRRPLQGDELKKLDLVVLDPPRAGARMQCEALAGNEVPVVAYVSCNPATFARDARTLVDGGYRLERVVPVDQFLWSAHVELVATLRR
jgi:23S rRNA (uracil1939-C5)-methyltransferase